MECAGTCSNFLFICLKNCLILLKHLHCFVVSPSLQHLLLSVLLILVILVGAKWNIIVILFPTDHFFNVCFLDIHALLTSMQSTLRCWLDWVECDTKTVFIFKIFYFSKCPAGTCDGCTFYFLWESAEACPLCTEHDFHEIEGACKRGLQVRIKSTYEELCHWKYSPSVSHCLHHRNSDLRTWIKLIVPLVICI